MKNQKGLARSRSTTEGFVPIIAVLIVVLLGAGTYAVVSRDVLKSYFEKGDRPTESNRTELKDKFEDGDIPTEENRVIGDKPTGSQFNTLIDSSINIREDAKKPTEITKVVSENLGQKTSCPEPFIFDFPIDITKATSILYPGQIRGSDFKAHGGFRFDGYRPEEIEVVTPIDAPVVAGARYPVNGELQYTLEFEHPCGIRYRLGHILTLTPKFQAIVEKFPLPTTLDSRTTEVRPPVVVKKGEIVATAVGLTGEGVGGTGKVNTFLDWGVYDYRQKNEASQDPVWAASHLSDTYQYGVCWFDWISSENRAKVLGLPSSDGINGKQSDFCK